MSIFKRGTPEPLPSVPSCAEVARVLQAFLDGELGPQDAELVAEHLAACEVCEVEAQTVTEVRDAIRRQRPAEDAYEAVLRFAGASRTRDSVDERIVEEVRTGTARFGNRGIIDSQEDVGGWPELRSEPAPKDSDGDGIPDEWKRQHGLQVGDPEEGNRDRNGDGYTNLEEYLNSLVRHLYGPDEADDQE